MPDIVARWQDWAAQGLEHLVLRDGSSGWIAESLVIGEADGERFAGFYVVECDRDWRTTHVAVSFLGKDPALTLLSDGDGHWQDLEGTLQDLDGAIDVDIT